MDNPETIAFVAMLGGFAGGVLTAWMWMLPLSSQRRDAFLAGVRDGINPMFWFRRLVGR